MGRLMEGANSNDFLMRIRSSKNFKGSVILFCDTLAICGEPLLLELCTGSINTGSVPGVPEIKQTGISSCVLAKFETRFMW